MIGENIKRYRVLKGLSLRNFGELVNMSQTAIMKYEKDILKPDGEKLIMFANVLGCSVLDLLKDNSNRRKLDLKYRKREYLSDKKISLLNEIISTRINNYLDVLELNNISNIKLKKYKVFSLEDASKAAINFRVNNKLNEILPLINLCNIIENLGISIIMIDNKDDKFKGFDGLSEVVDGYPFICVASNINYYRQRFTLAHELGHLILDIDGSLDEEKVCNEFASSLLLPKKAMNLEFGIKRVYISDREFEIARDEYHVSIKAIIYSLERNGIITSSNAKSSYINFNKNLLEKENELSKRYKETPRKYEQLTNRLYNQELITESRFNELSLDFYNEKI